MMTITTRAARALVERLVQEHDKPRSWRAIADDFPRRPDGTQIVKAGTICRIADEAGAWLPKDREILIALGLVRPRIREEQPEWLQRRKKAIRRIFRRPRSSGSTGAFEGADVANLGAGGVDGLDYVTFTFGIHVRFLEHVTVSAAYEVPITEHESITRQRITTAVAWEF